MNDRDKQWQMGYKIASRRSALGLSQEALAEAVGISRVSIVRIENGDQLPKVETVVGICEALHVTPNELYPRYLSEHIVNSQRIMPLLERLAKMPNRKQDLFYQMAEVFLRGLETSKVDNV